MAPPNQEDPPPPPPTGHVVGSGVGIETLTEAIALGKMLDYPAGCYIVRLSDGQQPPSLIKVIRK